MYSWILLPWGPKKIHMHYIMSSWSKEKQCYMWYSKYRRWGDLFYLHHSEYLLYKRDSEHVYSDVPVWDIQKRGLYEITEYNMYCMYVWKLLSWRQFSIPLFDNMCSWKVQKQRSVRFCGSRGYLHSVCKWELLSWKQFVV